MNGWSSLGRSAPPPSRHPAQRWLVRLLSLAALLAATAPARAQMGQMGGLHGGRQHGDQQQNAQQPAAPPRPAAMPEVWPRLDPGTVLCASSADLLRYQERLEAPSGPAPAGPPPNCRTVTVVTPIKILDHDGPSRTHVEATDASKQTGWTAAYLPPSPGSR